MKFIRRVLLTLAAGFRNAWTHKGNGLASVLAIAAVSVIIGIVLIVTLSLNIILQDVQARVDEVEVYISDDLADEGLADLQESLVSHPAVASLDYKDKDEALEIMKESWGEDAYLLEGLERDNPLERSFLVTLADIEKTEDFVTYAEDQAGVSNVIYYQETVDKIVNLSRYISLAGLGLSLIMLVISIILIYNTVKLTVQTRSEEIQIMKYLGASDISITVPYIIEGIIYGLLGSLLAYMIIYYGYSYIYDNFSTRLYQLISTYMVDPEVLKGHLLIIFAMLGIVIGSVGSVFSAKKYLKV